MKMQRTALATALAAALGLGMAGQASADVFAGSALGLDGLTILFQDAAPPPSTNNASGNVAINNFNFSLTNTALINGAGAIQGASCGGTIGVNTCGVSPANTLNSLPANANATNVRAPLDFTWFPLGGGNWSNSLSTIFTSELSSGGANPTSTNQIAQSNITTANSASASAEIQSVTGFTLNFTVGGTNPVFMVLDFMADPDMRAEIFNDLGIAFGAQSNMAVTMTLQKDGVFGVGASWAPGGDLATNDCTFGGGVTCVERADTQNLNLSIGTSTNNTFANNSYDPNAANYTAFGMTVGGLTAGNWTLTLRAQTSTNLTRTAAVPEPSSLALVALAMLGVGGATLRRRKL